jgi:hypothetical protein
MGKTYRHCDETVLNGSVDHRIDPEDIRLIHKQMARHVLTNIPKVREKPKELKVTNIDPASWITESGNAALDELLYVRHLDAIQRIGEAMVYGYQEAV